MLVVASKVGDHRVFNVSATWQAEYFDQHPYVVIETPESASIIMKRCAWVIVPESNCFYRTSFEDDKDFTISWRRSMKMVKPRT